MMTNTAVAPVIEDVSDVSAAPLLVHTMDATSTRDCHQWDQLAASEHGTFCHLHAWRGIMEDVLGHQTHYLMARAENGKLAGALPLVSVRSRLFGRYLLSMPFLNYGGPLGSQAARAALSGQAIDLAKQLNVDLLELRARDAAPTGLAVSSRKIAVMLPLAPTAEQMWEQQFRSKLRNKIKRPMNHGMDVRFGAAELDPFYEIFARNMRDLGTPVLPRRWFASIQQAMPDIVIFGAVYWQGIPVAAGCGFLWNNEFELTWSSALREHNSKHPNMLLCWSLMQECIRRGATMFNFGRSTPDSNTHHFKEQWGGHDVALPWGAWGSRTAPPNPNSPKYRLARHAWSRLPFAISKSLGPTLARQLP
jgi:serine/alanine adding enzyme